MSDNVSIETVQETFQGILNERVSCVYTEEEEETIKDQHNIYKAEMRILSRTRKSIIFENQREIAYKVVIGFGRREIINMMVVSKTQSGKTGSMCATISRYIEENLIPTDNIYIITALSSCEWKEQTKERIPECIRVFHRDELHNLFVEEISSKKNILIIMDEIQVAAKKGQTIYKSFQQAGLLDLNYLYQNDIKILEYTATPDGTIYDLMKWNASSLKILAEVGIRYVSSHDLYKYGRFCQGEPVLFLKSPENNQWVTGTITETYENDLYDIQYQDGLRTIKLKKVNTNHIQLLDPTEERLAQFHSHKRIKQYKDLCGYNKNTGEVDAEVLDNINEIKMDVDNFTRPLYHIIRTKNGPEQDITIENFKVIFGEEDYEYIKYDRESDIEDINGNLKNSPDKHTFIFIKEMLRCAKTLVKSYIGILYERYSKSPDDSTIIQGLVGRDTGYDNNSFSICYTNIDSIERYEKLWVSNFEDNTIKWNSKTTKNTNGILSGKNTFNDPKEYDGFSVASDDSDELKEPVIKKFKTQEEAKEYYNKELKEKMKGRGPNKIKPNNDGYYEATIRSNKKIYTCDEVKHERRQGLTENNYRFYPCYEVANDKSTLQWWFIHM
jgi:hypothetical protein